MSNDKPRYRLKDTGSNECIYCDIITGTELAWIYLHYVTQDNSIALRIYDEDADFYVYDSEEDYRFNLLLHNIYYFGIKF